MSRSQGDLISSSDALILAGLSLRQLRLMRALEEHGQMGRAATSLRISQPAASKLLSQVEAIVGVELFERVPRGVVPTVYGEVFLRHTRTLLTEISMAKDEISALQTGRGGRVAVGSVVQPAIETVAAAIGEFQKSGPRLKLSFEIDTSEALVSRLVANKLDLVIARIPPSADPTAFDYVEIAHESALLVVRRDHPLACHGRLPLAEAANFTWVLEHQGSLLRKSWETLLLRLGSDLPSRIIETSSFLATMTILSGTDAVAPMVVPCANLLSDMGLFTIIDPPKPILVEPYGLIRVKKRPSSPAVSAFYDRLKIDFGLTTDSLSRYRVY